MMDLTFRDGDAVPMSSITYAANAYGIVRAINCRKVLDYDRSYNLAAVQRIGQQRPLKTAFIFGRAWPDAGNNSTMDILLPKGSILKLCAFRKAANGGAATAGYQLAMVDGGLNQYCASTIAAQNVQHKGLADNLMIVLDDALGYNAGISASQTIFLLAVPGQTGSAQSVPMGITDYAMVEYY
jgi:hypothetical protein